MNQTKKSTVESQMPNQIMRNRNQRSSGMSLDQFVKLDVKNISINLMGAEKKRFKTYYKISVSAPDFGTFMVQRNYNEFFAFYAALKLKYTNLDLPEFPNRYQLFGKVATRTVAFHLILNRILETAKQENQGSSYQQGLLKTLYIFLTKDQIEQAEQMTPLGFIKDEELLDDDNIDFSSLNTSASLIARSLTTRDSRSLTFKQSADSMYNSFKMFFQKDDLSADQKKKKLSYLSGSVAFNRKIKSTNFNQHNFIIDSEFDAFKETALTDLTKELPNVKGNIWVQNEGEEEWVPFYAKIQNSNLLLYHDISMNNYDILICCYGIKVELIEKPIYHIQLYHKHDSQKLCLSVCPNQQLMDPESKTREYIAEIDK